MIQELIFVSKCSSLRKQLEDSNSEIKAKNQLSFRKHVQYVYYNYKFSIAVFTEFVLRLIPHWTKYGMVVFVPKLIFSIKSSFG